MTIMMCQRLAYLFVLKGQVLKLCGLEESFHFCVSEQKVQDGYDGSQSNDHIDPAGNA